MARTAHQKIYQAISDLFSKSEPIDLITLMNKLQEKGELEAQKHKAHILLTGILPTIRFGDITLDNLTPLKRYKALTDLLHEMKGEPFEFFIEGPDSLVLHDVLSHRLDSLFEEEVGHAQDVDRRVIASAADLGQFIVGS